jgi:lysozyme family protein
MIEIETLLDELLRREGGFVDDPADRGGATNFGITEAVARAAGFAGSMRDLPRVTALAIYRDRYWSAPGFDAVAALNPRVAAELFDTGVNMGVGTATAFLQRSLNALNRQGRDWPDIEVDHRIGSQTLSALRGLLRVRDHDGEAVLLKALRALKGARYIAIAEARPANERFLFGWLANRVA